MSLGMPPHGNDLLDVFVDPLSVHGLIHQEVIVERGRPQSNRKLNVTIVCRD